jgi:signal transduction histidine kinase
LLIAFGLGLFFIPLRNRLQTFIDRLFFKKSPREIAEENILLKEEITKSDQLKMMSTLASGVAHEVKNPLTAIKTFAEFLPQKLNDKEFLTKFARIVGKEVERIDELVHDLMNFAKPSPLKLEPVGLNKYLNDILDILNSSFLKNKITVERNLAATADMTIRLDQKQFKQALLNILLNAVDAMGTGGTLSIGSRVEGLGARKPSSNHTLDPRPDTLTIPYTLIITIADTGPGISPQDLKHIFDPFFTKKDHGTGLGLPITKGIIEQHRGKLTIKSKDGAGTEARIELPA